MILLKRTIQLLSGQVVNALLLLAIVLFTTGAYNWAFKVYRTQAQTINPVMYPSFTTINVTEYAPEQKESYYKLWRTFDWMADGYTSMRKAGVYHRVPIVYVHGNGGSYYCARSLARFVYESNARLRHAVMLNFKNIVRQHLYEAYRSNTSLEPLQAGDQVPNWLRYRVEERVIREEAPLLGVELFSVDYLEESSTQSANLVVKESRFFNRSVHLVVNGFLKTYEDVLAAPPAPYFDEEAFKDHSQGDNATSSSNSAPSNVLGTLKSVEKEYIQSVCQNPSIPSGPIECQNAKRTIKRFSTLERVRAEVERVRDRGIWIWGESLGGFNALLGATMAPHLYAGVVLIGTPIHYPPLFFDHATVWLYEAMNSAIFQDNPSIIEKTIRQTATWNLDERLRATSSPGDFVSAIRKVPKWELSERLSNVTLIAINGGTLDDVVPSISGYLQRSTPRYPGTAVKRSTLKQRGANRRDVSTETLRGCGAAMDHRGLVYGLQFLQHSADSLVTAALYENSEKYFGVETSLPSMHRDRLFPTVVETISPEREIHQREAYLFSLALSESPSGNYVKAGDREALAAKQTKMCVSSSTPINLNDIPMGDEADDRSGYYGGEAPLNLLIGFTTLEPEKVHMPTLQLFRDAAHTTPMSSSVVQARIATKFYLPTTFKGTKPIPGRTLQTAMSGVIRRLADKATEDVLMWPELCFYVSGSKTKDVVRNYLQYDKIDAAAFHMEAEGAASKGTSSVLPPVMGSTHVATHPGYVLITGIDSALLEPNVSVKVSDTNEVFPVTIAGSLHSFYLATRGQGGLAYDEPEHQLQYFFGPFQEGLHNFTYGWKPFSTFPPLTNETYLIYTLSDTTNRAEVDVPTYEGLSTATILSPFFWKWIVTLWPQRWLAAFSMYTGIAKQGGSGVMLFYGIFFASGMLDQKVYPSSSSQPGPMERFLRRIGFTNPVAKLLFLIFFADWLSGIVVHYTLPLCTSTDPPLHFSDAEMTHQLGLVERLSLMLLAGTRPSYENCRRPWIMMQTVPVWSTIFEHFATLYIAACLAVLFAITLAGYFCAVAIVSWPLRRLFLSPCLQRLPRCFAAVLAAMWIAPWVVRYVCPGLPLCFVDLLAVTFAVIPCWMLPQYMGSGYALRLIALMAAVTASFPSHFNGLVLSLRNLVLLRDSPLALADSERYVMSWPQVGIFITTEFFIGSLYVGVYFLLLSERGLKQLQEQKKAQQQRIQASSTTPGAAVPDIDVVDTKRIGYTLGSIGQRYPRLHRAVVLANTLSGPVVLWVSIIAIRRPVEGGATLIGNMIGLLYLCTYILKHV